MVRTYFCTTLMWLVPLALLPGCQHLPWSSGESGGQRFDEQPRLMPAPTSQRGMNTAYNNEPDAPPQPKKPISTPPITGPVNVVPLGPAPPLRGPDLSPPLDPKSTTNMGTPGVSFVDSILEEGQPVSLQQGGIPLPPIRTQDPSKKPDFGPFVKALQLLLEKRDETEALRHLAGYDKKTQDFFLEFLPMFSFLAVTPFDELTPPQAAMLNEQLYHLLVMLRPRSELSIGKMCYCKRVNGFGHYVTLPDSYQFLAARDKPGEQVLVYVELKNFSSEPTPEGDFLTKLACGLELRDTTGKVVWSHAYDRKDTTTRPKTRLNDFYRNFSFCVPPIPPGAYRLTVEIVDETIPELRRTARKSLEFRVTPVPAQSSMR